MDRLFTHERLEHEDAMRGIVAEILPYDLGLIVRDYAAMGRVEIFGRCVRCDAHHTCVKSNLCRQCQFVCVLCKEAKSNKGKGYVCVTCIARKKEMEEPIPNFEASWPLSTRSDVYNDLWNTISARDTDEYRTAKNRLRQLQADAENAKLLAFNANRRALGMQGQVDDLTKRLFEANETIRTLRQICLRMNPVDCYNAACTVKDPPHAPYF